MIGGRKLIHIRIRGVQKRLDQKSLVHVFLKLSELGWKPAFLDSLMVFLERASLPPERLPEIYPIPPMPPPYRRGDVSGEIFFAGDQDVFFLVAASQRRFISWGDRFDRPRTPLTQENKEPLIVVGIITCAEEEMKRRLDEFTTAVETAIKSLDVENAANMALNWEDISPGTPNLDRIREEAASREIVLQRPELGPELINAVNIFADKASRELLIEISKAGFALERNLIRRKSRDSEKVQVILEGVRHAGLVDVEYVLQCKQQGTVLTRLKNPDQIKVPEIAELQCPFCKSNFGQEDLSVGYSLSELGRRLLQGSHWMTVFVTNLLIKLGVTVDAVLWYVTEAGGEVDILAEVMESLWILELKDKEFGAGDAYALNHRQAIYGADKTVVVTTERVSPDAKQALEWRQTEERRYGRRGTKLVYIEGLEEAEHVLEKEISLSRLRYALQWLSPLEMISGYDIGKILSIRFGA